MHDVAFGLFKAESKSRERVSDEIGIELKLFDAVDIRALPEKIIDMDEERSRIKNALAKRCICADKTPANTDYVSAAYRDGNVISDIHQMEAGMEVFGDAGNYFGTIVDKCTDPVTGIQVIETDRYVLTIGQELMLTWDDIEHAMGTPLRDEDFEFIAL